MHIISRSLLKLSVIAFCFLMYSSIFAIKSFPAPNVEYVSGLFIHTVFSFFFVTGIFLKQTNEKIVQRRTPVYVCDLGILVLLSTIFSMGGLYAAFNSSPALVDINEYFSNLIGGDNNSRSAFELASEDGGAPGVFKLLAFSINGAYAGVVMLIHQKIIRTDIQVSLLLFGLLVVLLIKTAIFLDRATLLLVFIGIILVLAQQRFFRLFAPIIVVLGFGLFNLLSYLRLAGFGILDFIGLYSLLGVANFSIAITKLDCIDFGVNTIFSAPALLLFKTVGWELMSTCVGDNWIYNPAQYFFSHVFLDFRYLSPVFLIGFGAMLSKVEKNVNSNGMYSNAIYMHLIVAVLMMVGVTTLRGLEFYFSIVVTYLIIKVSVRRISK